MLIVRKNQLFDQDWQDAIEWVACACNDDRVTVTDTAGFVLATRG